MDQALRLWLRPAKPTPGVEVLPILGSNIAGSLAEDGNIFPLPDPVGGK
jgi:hypothetical protein